MGQLATTPPASTAGTPSRDQLATFFSNNCYSSPDSFKGLFDPKNAVADILGMDKPVVAKVISTIGPAIGKLLLSSPTDLIPTWQACSNAMKAAYTVVRYANAGLEGRDFAESTYEDKANKAFAEKVIGFSVALRNVVSGFQALEGTGISDSAQVAFLKEAVADLAMSQVNLLAATSKHFGEALKKSFEGAAKPDDSGFYRSAGFDGPNDSRVLQALCSIDSSSHCSTGATKVAKELCRKLVGEVVKLAPDPVSPNEEYGKGASALSRRALQAAAGLSIVAGNTKMVESVQPHDEKPKLIFLETIRELFKIAAITSTADAKAPLTVLARRTIDQSLDALGAYARTLN